MRKEFEFETAQELIDCLEKNKEYWQGKKVTAFYRDSLSSSWTDDCVAFLLDKYVIILNYHFLSLAYGEIVPKEKFLADINNGGWGKYSWGELALRNELFFIGEPIRKIKIGRFSREFEINASTGETRPQGGDYFGEILITLDSGRVLRIVAEDAEFDGYMDIEEVSQNEKEHWTMKCGYREYLTEII